MIILLTILVAGIVTGFAFSLIFKKIPMSEGESDRMATGITRVLLGHAVTLVLSLLFMVPTIINGGELSAAIRSLPIFLWLWAGWVFLFQLIYVIPLLIEAKAKNRKETLKGILIAFGVTFLLSGLTCGGSLLLLMGGKISV